MAIIDARTLPDASLIEADLIIIGGGMAGVALATELAGGPLKVAVLESGGMEIDGESQALYAGSAVQRAPGNPDRPFDDYPIQSRVRALGGSGHVWGGKCAPLDPADFAERAWIPHSGWPVTREAMQPYYDRACDLLEIAHFPLERPVSTTPDHQPLALDDADGFFPAPRAFSRVSGGVEGRLRRLSHPVRRVAEHHCLPARQRHQDPPAGRPDRRPRRRLSVRPAPRSQGAALRPGRRRHRERPTADGLRRPGQPA